MPCLVARSACSRAASRENRYHRSQLEAHGDSGQVIEAVIFDLDGVLIDSEQTWNSAREQLVRERGGTWREEATRERMGMGSPGWARYMRGGRGPDQRLARRGLGRHARHRGAQPRVPTHRGGRGAGGGGARVTRSAAPRAALAPRTTGSLSRGSGAALGAASRPTRPGPGLRSPREMGRWADGP